MAFHEYEEENRGWYNPFRNIKPPKGKAYGKHEFVFCWKNGLGVACGLFNKDRQAINIPVAIWRDGSGYLRIKI